MQETGATLPVGVPDVPGLGAGGNRVPVTDPDGEAGLPLGASGLPVTGPVGVAVSVTLGVAGGAWPPPLCSMLQPPKAMVVINSPGMINAVARGRRTPRGNVRAP